VPLAIGWQLDGRSGELRASSTAFMRLSFFYRPMLQMIRCRHTFGLFFYARVSVWLSQILAFLACPSSLLGATETALGSMMLSAIWKEAGYL